MKGAAAAGIVLNAGPGESDYTRYDRLVADTACDWLGRASAMDTPWVLFVSFVTPHYPLTAPEEFFRLYPIDDMPEPKLGAGSGFTPHPWLSVLHGENAGAEASPEQHRTAIAAYLGLCSFMDAQVGRVLTALGDAGLRDDTRILYTSDHGDNAGARGLWGKSVHYEEASGIPVIVAGDGVPEGKVCTTPTSLVDAYPTILQATATAMPENEILPGRSWFDLATAPDDPERIAFSEYHAARSPSGSFMIRKGRYKYIRYIGFESELFDLQSDPEEITNLAADAAYADVLRALDDALLAITDPIDADRRANAAQKALIESRGGPEEVMRNLITTSHYTPVPDAFMRTES